MSLTEAFNQADRNNPALLAERARLRASDEEVAQVVGQWRPSLSITASRGAGREIVTGGTPVEDQNYQGLVPSDTYGLTLTETIFSPGRSASKRKALATAMAEEMHLASLEQTTFLKIAQDYLDVLRDQEDLALYAENERTTKSELDAGHARLSIGEINRLDLSQLDANYHSAIAQRHAAEAQLTSSQQSFERDAGSELSASEYPNPASLIDKGRAEASDSDANPDVLAALYTAKASEAAIEATEAQDLPVISLHGGVTHEDDAAFQNSRTNVLSVSIQLSWSLYQGGILESQARAAKEALIASRFDISTARRAAQSQMTTSRANIQAGKSSIAALTVAATANQLALEGTKHQQQAGERTVLDVLNAQHALLQSKQTLEHAIHDEMYAEFSLAASVGKLTSTALGLENTELRNNLYLRRITGKWFGFEPVD